MFGKFHCLWQIAIVLLFLVDPCAADWETNRADSHAPIAVMGEHTHDAGELMLSYRAMFMKMEGNRHGSSRLSTSSVLEDFMIAPTEMEMEMHMFGAMFAPNKHITLTLMLPFIDLEMSHVSRNGARFRTTSSGLGDITIGGLSTLINAENHQLILNTGISLPSGEIDERGDTPAAQEAKLPYPMQLGSGTVDLKPGITYLGQSETLSWGGQGIATVRLGRNDNDYSLGDRFDSTIWGAARIARNFSLSLRSTWSIWSDIDGADPELNPMMVATADPSRQGGRRAELGAGINFLVPEGDFKNLRLATEVLVPVYQNLDGPQLEADWTVTVGAQMSF